MSWEREYYALRCLACGQEGLALWTENDGPSFLRDPCTFVTVSPGFKGQSVAPTGAAQFFGHMLVCTECYGPAEAEPACPWPQYRRLDQNSWKLLK